MSHASQQLATSTTHHAAGAWLRAITFDAGGTLIGCWPSVGHIYGEVASSYSHKVFSPVILNRRFKAAWRAFKIFRHTRSDWSALVDATFQGLIDPAPSQTFFPQLFRRFAKPDAWHIYRDVIPTLESLRSRGFKLGIVSNWDERLRPLLRRLKLDAYFEATIISCEVGAAKPSPQIFRAACAQLGSAPETILHVGDSLQMDLRGARAAGFQALQLRRGAKKCRPGQIRTLGDLHKL